MKQSLLFALLCTAWLKGNAGPTATHEPLTYEPNPEALDREFTDEGERLWEGDMVLTAEQMDALSGGLDTRKAIDDLAKRWPDGAVPYAISASSKNDRDAILSALEHWKDNTCLTFAEVEEDAEEPHLVFRKQTGCHSKVGMMSTNGQTVSIGKNCGKMGTVAHEVGHAIGFFHEQCRPERDQHVKLLNHNLNQTKKNNFVVHLDSNDYGVQYDLGSIMHYGLDFFTTNGRNTLVPLDVHRNFEIGQRNALSFYDLKLANLMYKCADKCRSKPTCRNGGYVDSSCKCRCPNGFSGSQCQTRLSLPGRVCGGDFTSEATITTPNHPNKYPKDSSCVWVFEAPRGQRVSVYFPSFSVLHYNEGDPVCHFDYLEVRTADKYEGERYCAKDLHQQTLTSTGNKMILLFHSQTDWYRGFKAEVTFV